jgi:GxxExxY protein
LILRKAEFVPKAKIPLVYKGVELDEEWLEIDLFFPGKLIVELKAVERTLFVHEAQLLSYMRLTSVPVGLLINFNVQILTKGVTRRVL